MLIAAVQSLRPVRPAVLGLGRLARHVQADPVGQVLRAVAPTQLAVP